MLELFKDRKIANVDDRKRAMMVRHLLDMTSGFEWDEGVEARLSTESCYRMEQSDILKRLPIFFLHRRRAFRGCRDTRRCDRTQTRAGGA